MWDVGCVFCFFKQKTAYEMRISDWSSDVCSSDLIADGLDAFANYGYTHSRIKAYGVDPTQVGNWTPYVPKETWSMGLQYRTPITDDIGIFARGDVDHTGKQYWEDRKSTRLNTSH